jgi:hypothetical protein
MGEREIVFIFDVKYNQHKHTWTFPEEVTIKEMKFRMLRDNWPEHVVKSENVKSIEFMY